MIQLIDELKAIPGVVGASIVDSHDGLKATNLPTFFKPERLLLVGNHLQKLYSAGQASFNDLTDITMNFDESVVVARKLSEEIILFVICDPNFNNNLLNMSLNLLQDEFKASTFATSSAPAQSVPAPAEATKTATPPPANVKDELLDELLTAMEKALGKILGPMAEFIFAEVTDTWKEQGEADYSRINELIKLINNEIIDQKKIDNYRHFISPALENFKKG